LSYHQAALAHTSRHPFPTRRSSDLRLRQRLSQFIDGPRPVVPVIAEGHVRVLGRMKRTPLAIRQDLEHPAHDPPRHLLEERRAEDRKSTRLNSSHQIISYAVFCLKK